MTLTTSKRSLAHFSLRGLILVCLLLGLWLLAANPVLAAKSDPATDLPTVSATQATLPGLTAPTGPPGSTAGSTDPNEVQSPPTDTEKPAGHRLTGIQARDIGRLNSKYMRVKKATKGSYDDIWLKGKDRWQLSLYAPGEPLREIAQVIIDDKTGKVTEAWDVPYVAWTMARGYKGAFGKAINSPWIWCSLLALMLLPFVGLRPRRGPPLALLLLAAFSIPLAGFNNARLDIATPSAFILLMLLVAWCTWRALRKPGREPKPVFLWTPWWLLFLIALGLFVFRAVLSVTNGNVIDVGYASVVGAHRIGHGESLYGIWPSQIGNGDTYGPLIYLGYLPFEQIWPWKGTWDDLPAAHAASIAFDALTAILLVLLGRSQERRRADGWRRGLLYAYIWLACPFTAYVLSSGANDSLAAVAVALILLLGRRPLGRGFALGIAIATKIAPLVALPVLATRRTVAQTTKVAYGRATFNPLTWLIVGLAAATVIIWSGLFVVGDNKFTLLWERIIGYQAGRDAPFMPWGYYPSLKGGDTIMRIAVFLLAAAFAFLPRRHDLTGTAAAIAALLFAVQASGQYWIYHYLVWAIPAVILVAIGDRDVHLRSIMRREQDPVPAAHALESWKAAGPLPQEDAPWA